MFQQVPTCQSTLTKDLEPKYSLKSITVMEHEYSQGALSVYIHSSFNALVLFQMLLRRNVRKIARQR